jgi:hypothetical protein
MTSVSRRLRKLEAVIGQNRGFNITEVYDAALAKLTAHERVLVSDVLERRVNIEEEAHRPALHRFDAAYVAGADELGSPIRLTADDFLL